MAHANPDFALDRLRARIREIGRRVADDAPVSAGEREAYRLWLLVRRQDREKRPDLAAERFSRAGGMHGAPKAGERFYGPPRRFPADVQAGRVKPRRGTLPR